MKRFFKILLVLLLLTLAVLVGAGFWLKAQYPPERLRQIAADTLGEKLGRQVKMTNARLSLLHGLELTGVTISEPPDFSKGTFIAVERVRVFLRLLPLLSRQIIIRSIDLERPQIHLKRSAEGVFNFSDLTQPPPPSSEPPKGEGPNLNTFLISNATLTEGELTFRDDTLNMEVGLRALNFRVSGFSLTNPFSINAQGNLEIHLGTATWKGPLGLQARLSPWGDRAIQLENLRWGLGTTSLELNGVLSPFPLPHAAVTLNLDRLTTDLLSPFVVFPDALTGTHLSGRWKVHASTTALDLEGTFNAQGSDIELDGSVTARSWSEADGFHHQVNLRPKSFRLEGPPWIPTLTGSGPLGGEWTATASSGNWSVAGNLTANDATFLYDGWLEKPAGTPFTLTGSAKSRGPGEPRLVVDLRVPDLEITPGGPWPKNIRLNGTLGIVAECQGTPSDLAFDFTADGLTLEAAYSESFKKPADSTLVFSAMGRLRNQAAVQLTAASVRTSAGLLDIRGGITDLKGTKRLDLTLKGKQDLAQLSLRLPALAPYHLRGETTLDATVKGPAENVLIQGRFDLTDASLTALPGVGLMNLNGRIHFTPDRARIESLKGKAFGSPFTLSAQIENFDRPTIALDGDWARLEVEKVLKVFSATPSPDPSSPTKPATAPGRAPIAHIMGVFRIGEITHPHYVGRNFHFNWSLREMGPDLSVLSGTATVTAATGEIKDIPVAKKINKLMGREGSDITYKQLSGRFQVTQGVATIQHFTLDSDQTDFFANGRVRLGDMDSNLNLMLKLPPGSVRGSVGNWLTAEDGRPTIEAHLEGPLGNPQVKVNKADVIRRAAKDIFKKTLGGWKGKPDHSSSSTQGNATPTPTTSPTPIETLEDLGTRALEKLFRKQ